MFSCQGIFEMICAGKYQQLWARWRSRRWRRLASRLSWWWPRQSPAPEDMYGVTIKILVIEDHQGYQGHQDKRGRWGKALNLQSRSLKWSNVIKIVGTVAKQKVKDQNQWCNQSNQSLQDKINKLIKGIMTTIFHLVFSRLCGNRRPQNHKKNIHLVLFSKGKGIRSSGINYSHNMFLNEEALLQNFPSFFNVLFSYF